MKLMAVMPTSHFQSLLDKLIVLILFRLFWFQVYPDRSIAREMRNVMVYCKNKKGSEGCQLQLKLRELQVRPV